MESIQVSWSIAKRREDFASPALARSPNESGARPLLDDGDDMKKRGTPVARPQGAGGAGGPPGLGVHVISHKCEVTSCAYEMLCFYARWLAHDTQPAVS
ncbi:unnamed protein product, partial [Brenthis ino]